MPARWSDTGLPSLVGRRDELAVLEGAWSAVVGGRRQVVFIGGEPGAGKTRLLAEAAVRLHDEGAAVLLGACVKEFGPPYQPFVEPVAALHDALGAGELTAGAGRHDRPRGLLDRLATVAGGRRAGSPAEGSEAEYQRELYDAVVHAVTVAADDAPVVLALEDLQWARPTALSLLSHLVERTSEERLLVVATHRTTVPDRSAPLVHTVAQLYRLDGVRRLDLAGLETDDIARYLVEETGAPEHRVRVAAAVLRDQTGGNPFFLREMWRDLAARGGLSALRSGSFTAPESVRDTLQSRLDRLAEPHRQVLELAAVIGEEVELATLLAAGEWTADTTLAAVDEAVSHGLLEAAGGDGSEFRFPHALARATALDLMTPSRRVREHARVAEALERAPGEPAVRRLAHHYASARALGYSDKALHYLLEAARLAHASLAHEEAARCFEQAADLTDDAEERDLHRLAAARSHLLDGNFARARDVYEQVSGSQDPRTRAQAAIGYEAASWRPGLPGHRAVELLTAALSSIEHDESDPVYVRALASLGRATAFTGAIEEATLVVGRAIELARRLGDARLLADTLQASLWLGLRPQDAPAKLDRAAELSRLADRIGDPGHLGPAAYFRGVIAYMSGDPVGWDAAHHDLLRTARVTGQEFFAYMGGCLDYGRQMAAGQLGAAERTCADLLALGDSFGTDDTEGPYGVQMFMLRREAGRLDEVRHLVTGDENPAEHWAPGLLALYTELGLQRPAGRLMRCLLDEDLHRYESSAQWPGVLAFLAEASLALRDQAAAHRLRPMLAEFAGLNLVAGQFVAVFGSADRFLGSVDSLLERGDPDEWFAAAEDMDSRMGASAHLAHTLAAWAAHLRRAGSGPQRVRELVARSRSLAEPLGLRRVIAVLDEVAGSPATHAAPDGLTPRETEVLLLVCVGMSNRAIARELVISENTAANHVRSILAKTGCENRTQAAHYAASRGLLPR
jgi:DNA-binding CsgD family transcriptional regulator/tetratricopeptide (TPR) repeat protein